MDLFDEEPTAEETTSDAPAFLNETAEIEEGLQHPRLMNALIGHTKHEKALLDQFTKNRLHHGLILSGPKGIGKATFAYRFARFLLKNPASDPNQDSMFGYLPSEAPTSFDLDPNEPVFRHVSALGHPDLFVIEREYDATKDKYKDSVAVDAVRKVNPFLRMTASNQGGWRVVIIDDADTMNRNAQNAILKILEEPPANTVLILICHRLGAMIPTIRSRTRTLNFEKLSEGQFEDVLSKGGYNLTAEQSQTLYALSNGSVGSAIEYIERDGLDTLALILGMFQSYPNWSWPEIHKLSDSLGRAGQTYQSFTELLPWVFTQMIMAKAKGTQLSSSLLQSEALQDLHKQSSLESLLKICENLKSHFDRAERSNLDKRQAVLSAFSIISA